MKKGLLLGLAFLLISSFALAQIPQVGLYADVDHSTWCGYGAMIKFYLFVNPGETGLDTVEFQTVLSDEANVGIMWINYSEDIAGLPLGGIPGDCAISLLTCHNDWTEMFNATAVPQTDDPYSIALVPNSGNPEGEIVIVDCFLTKVEPQNISPVLYINTTPCPENATRESTWGAIKNMYE